MERIEEFTVDGKNFVYIDLTDFASIDDFLVASKGIKAVIAKYPKKSLYTITNIRNMRFDSESKTIMADYMKHNEPYVKYGVVIGVDGIKKIMALSTFKVIGRTNMGFAFSREQAIEWLLQREVE
jgi:hypothetical protein